MVVKIMTDENESTILKAKDYEGDLREILENYDYQPDLTPELDDIENDFDQDIINKINLWKSNISYAKIDEEVMEDINNLQSIDSIDDEKEKIEEILKELLSIKGIRIGRASTILRFRNPKVFQIMDKRAYRAVFGEKLKNSSDNIVDKYFQYLKELKDLCEAKDFVTSSSS